MTKYLSPEPFTVGAGRSKAYRDNWDRIFGKKPSEPEQPEEKPQSAGDSEDQTDTIP